MDLSKSLRDHAAKKEDSALRAPRCFGRSHPGRPIAIAIGPGNASRIPRWSTSSAWLEYMHL